MLGTTLWIVAGVLIFIAGLTAAWGGLRAAPYLPTRQQDVERMLKLANIQPGEVVYDLGAGDGRFMITAAQRYGARAIGYEISLLPYLAARWRMWRAQVGQQATIRAKDFFHTDLSDANVVVCFLTPGAMKKLGQKFKRELRPGTRIVSYAFSIADWTPEVKDKPDPKTMSVYLYRIPA
jgi:tRNA A58 N-methylase Trm61